MKFKWEPSYHGDDVDLYLTLDDGRSGMVAFVRPARNNPSQFMSDDTRWLALSMLGDFPDEDVPLPTKRAAMLKARRESMVLWISVDQETRDARVN